MSATPPVGSATGEGRRLRVLSLGFTRELWDESNDAQGDSLTRLSGYARYLDAYHVLVHSLREHALPTPRQLGPGFWAHATGGRWLGDSWLRMLALARRLLRSQPFDLVQSQDPVFTGTVGQALSALFGLPHNVCVYGANPFDPHWVGESVWTRLTAPLGRGVLRCAQGVQVDGARTRASLAAARIAPERIAVKPMVPADIATFLGAEPDPLLRGELSDQGRFAELVLFVGRLARQKNVPLLLEAASALVPRRPGLRFICLGEGPERGRLEQETARRGLTERVHWLGGRPHGEVGRFMATCDVFVLPSLYEGFARVLMEAAAAGRPIVTTDVSGADEALRSGETGLVVPVGDAAAMQSAIEELLRDPRRAAEMGRHGRAHLAALAARHGSPRRQIEIWEELVTRAGRGARPPRRPRETSGHGNP